MTRKPGTRGACLRCSGPNPDCWTDGRDAFLKFSLSSPRDLFFSGEGTAYHTTNTALFDDALGAVDCNPGPRGGDFWGRFGRTVPAGDWYAVSDASVGPTNSVNQRRGNFQLRIHNQTTDPLGYASWETADLPLTWTEAETELLATGVKFVNIVSPNAAGLIAIPDVTQLAIDTNSLDKDGNPFIETINGDGTGLSIAILDAIRSLVGDTRRDISLVPEDVLAFADGTVELARIPVRVMVPETGGSYGAGFYENTYDSDIVCRLPPEIPSERPDWGTLTCTGSTPSDSQIVFEFFTGDTLAELDSQVPASVTYVGDVLVPNPPVQSYDIDIPAALLTEAKQNYGLYLRVRARLQASTDTSSTPVFAGWSMEFYCVQGV